MCKNGSLWDSLWLIHLPSFAECQTGPTWLWWGSYPAVSWPSVLNLSQLVCAVRHPVQVFVVSRIPYEFSLSRSEGRTWNGGTRIYICSWKGIYRAVCPEACCEMRVRHWLNTTLKIPEQKPLCIWLAGTMENFVHDVLSVNNCLIDWTHVSRSCHSNSISTDSGSCGVWPIQIPIHDLKSSQFLNSEL